MQCNRKLDLIEYGKIGLLMIMGINIKASGINRLMSIMEREYLSTLMEVYLRDISKMISKLEEEDTSRVIKISMRESIKVMC